MADRTRTIAPLKEFRWPVYCFEDCSFTKISLAAKERATLSHVEDFYLMDCQSVFDMKTEGHLTRRLFTRQHNAYSVIHQNQTVLQSHKQVPGKALIASSARNNLNRKTLRIWGRF